MKWAVCLNNSGYEIDLEPRKLYQVIDDEKADANGCVRILDDSGESYLYDAKRFMLMAVPRAVEELLA